jgi:DNA-binding transcriptional LysR family regulator
MQFILDSKDAQLLISFEQNPGLEKLAQVMAKDPTVISRQLKRIAEKGDFLTKISGRWAITGSGKAFNQITKDYILSQNNVLNNKVGLRIGSTREFCSQVLAEKIHELKDELEIDTVSFHSYESGIEAALLGGEIDLGFECGRPYSPDIIYRPILSEPIVAVVSKKEFSKYSDIKKFRELEDFSHILCDRLAPDAISKKIFRLSSVSVKTNDIACARTLCLNGVGWALLPYYTVKEYVKSGKLKVIPNIEFEDEKFGVWCLRNREGVRPYFKKAKDWLQKYEDILKV